MFTSNKERFELLNRTILDCTFVTLLSLQTQLTNTVTSGTASSSKFSSSNNSCRSKIGGLDQVGVCFSSSNAIFPHSVIQSRMKIGLNDFFLSYCHFNGLLAQSCAIPMNKDFRSISRNTFERIPLAMSTRQFTCVTVFRTPAISSLPTNQIFILGHGTQIGLPTMTGLWEHAFH